ncbi:MAG TPA: complex I subunit 1 family protein [Chitinivibrionales bacterium]|jgi:formate hydrogenlyase subunit 4|nr:complex I subunit 1 family protein [Chitinivibrionales bacterium]
MKTALWVVAWVVLAPFIGGLLAGVDRIITARMQSRVGPPVLQPFYDVLKLFGKRGNVVNAFQNFYMICFLVFVIVTGCLFFSGGDLLLTIFALAVAGVFFVLGAFSPNSPYSNIGAERELLQMMSYEPVLIIMAVGMFMVTKSWHVDAIAGFHQLLFAYLPGVFVAFLFVLTIKLRKSPFDLSMSHHGHQELVKGATTEFSGPALAVIEIAHWYENILLMGFVYLFFACNWIAAIAAVMVTYFIEIFIDNTFARLTWRFTVKSSWIVAGVFGVVNIFCVAFLIK